MRQAFRLFIIAIFSICCVAISPNLAIAAPIKIVAIDFTKQPAIAGHTEAGMHGSITIQPSP